MEALRAFSKQAAVFDDLYATDEMIRYKRERVRAHMQRHLRPRDTLLEINCGTGEDAHYWWLEGYAVTATDGSTAMIREASRKYPDQRFEPLSFDQLARHQALPSFSYLYSNFGGLNCIGDAPERLREAGSHMPAGTRMTLVIISSFCFWESLLLFKGKFKTATRRWFRKRSAAQVEGLPFDCYYYAPASFMKRLGREWTMLELEALCLTVPPSYIEGFNHKYPNWFRWLKYIEERFAHARLLRGWGDYFILTVEKINAPA